MTEPAEETVSLEPFFAGLKSTLTQATSQSLAARRTEAQLGAAADTTAGAYEDAVAGLAKWAPPPRALDCRAGCTHCCHVTVVADGATVLRIARYIAEALLPDSRARILDRMARHQQARSGLVSVELERRRDPCPLLEDGRCSVYPVRPLVCRSFNSMNVSTCEREIRGGETAEGIDAWRIPWLVGLAVNQGLMDGLAAAGLDDGEIELIPALTIALEARDTADRWLAGDTPFVSARWKGEAGSR